MENHKEVRSISGNVEIRMEGEGENQSQTIAGYAIVFNKSTNMGYYNEIIDSGALANTDMTDVVALFNHDENYPMARTGSVNNLILSIDNVGLKYEFKAMNECGERVAENIKLGIIRGSSFAFRTRSQEWIDTDGEPSIRRITDIEKIYDVSPVLNPAYNDTTVALRSKPKHEEKAQKQQDLIDLKIDLLNKK